MEYCVKQTEFSRPFKVGSILERLVKGVGNGDRFYAAGRRSGNSCASFLPASLKTPFSLGGLSHIIL